LSSVALGLALQLICFALELSISMNFTACIILTTRVCIFTALLPLLLLLLLHFLLHCS
jgi:hypothetical protein